MASYIIPMVYSTLRDLAFQIFIPYPDQSVHVTFQCVSS